jgi:hypothetical protein
MKLSLKEQENQTAEEKQLLAGASKRLELASLAFKEFLEQIQANL